MKHKLSRAFRYGITILATGSAFAILFWIYSPPKEAVSVSPSPIPVLTKIVKEDNTCSALGFNRCAILQLTRCKNVDAKGRVIISLVSMNTQIFLPTATDSGERKCDSDIKLPFPIPSQTPPGKYHIHFRAAYKINPITTITQDYDTQEFEIQ